MYGGRVAPSTREGLLCHAFCPGPAARADGGRATPGSAPAAPRVLTLPEARWALASLVLFLIALPLNLLGAPAWLWGPLFAATYVTGGWEPGWEAWRP